MQSATKCPKTTDPHENEHRKMKNNARKWKNRTVILHIKWKVRPLSRLFHAREIVTPKQHGCFLSNPSELQKSRQREINQPDPAAKCFSNYVTRLHCLWEECFHTPRLVHGKEGQSRLPVVYANSSEAKFSLSLFGIWRVCVNNKKKLKKSPPLPIQTYRFKVGTLFSPEKVVNVLAPSKLK